MSRPRVPVPSPSECDDVLALLGRWWFSPEDGQVEVGGVVGVVSSDRSFDEHGCHFGVVMKVWDDLLRQNIAPETFFLHQKPPDDLLFSAHSLPPWTYRRIGRATYFFRLSWKRKSPRGS